MDKKSGFHAEVDGKEIPIELVDGNVQIDSTEYGEIPRWKTFLPFIFAGAILVGIAFVSISVLIWALPLLVPVAIIWFIAKAIGGR